MKVRDTSGREVKQEELNMGSHKVINVTDPASAQDAATKTYVDTADGTHVNAADPHTGYVKESVVNAKGDLFAGTAANTVTRQAVGANDTVLTANSATSTGVEWGTTAHPQWLHQALSMTAYSGNNGTWTWALLLSVFHLRSAGNDAEYVEYSIWLPAGDYAVSQGYYKTTDSAICKVYVDNVLKDTEDMYTGVGIWTAWTWTFTFATTGTATIKYLADGKHASSSAYRIRLTAAAIGRLA